MNCRGRYEKESRLYFRHRFSGNGVIELRSDRRYEGSKPIRRLRARTSLEVRERRLSILDPYGRGGRDVNWFLCRQLLRP